MNVRGLGLLKGIQKWAAVLISQHNGIPAVLHGVAEVKEGYCNRRLAGVGRNGEKQHRKEAPFSLQREQSLPALEGLRKKITALNQSPSCWHDRNLDAIYDRTALIDTTTDTVWHMLC